MSLRRYVALAAIAVGTWGLLGTAPARAQEPKVDPAARQRFVAMLTSVKPKVTLMRKAVTPVTKGSLRAFAGGPPGTPIKLPGRN